MGTHSLIFMRVRNARQNKFVTWCVLYQQFDGYPEGVGRALCLFLANTRLVNGIPVPIPADSPRLANGAGCLFAQLIRHFKKTQQFPGQPESEAGGAYLHDPTTEDLEEWNYNVDVDPEHLSVRVAVFREKDKYLFEGTPAEVLAMIEEKA